MASALLVTAWLDTASAMLVAVSLESVSSMLVLASSETALGARDRYYHREGCWRWRRWNWNRRLPPRRRMPVNSMGDAAHAVGQSSRAHTKLCRRFGCRRAGGECEADDVGVWQDCRRYSLRVLSHWSPHAASCRWIVCPIDVSSRYGVQYVVRQFVRLPMETLGSEPVPSGWRRSR